MAIQEFCLELDPIPLELDPIPYQWNCRRAKKAVDSSLGRIHINRIVTKESQVSWVG